MAPALASTTRRVVLGSLRRRRAPVLDTTTRVTVSSPRP
jgi:hypothetical protein